MFLTSEAVHHEKRVKNYKALARLVYSKVNLRSDIFIVRLY